MIVSFFENHGFIIEFLVATYIFVMFQKKRKKFILRSLISITILVFLSFLFFYVLPDNLLGSITKFTLMYIAMMFAVNICYETNFINSLFYVTGAFAVQHSAFQIGFLIQTLLGTAINTSLLSASYVFVVAIVYVLAFYLFSIRLKNRGNVPLTNKNNQIVLVSVALVFFTIIFQNVFNYFIANENKLLTLAISGYDLLCSILALWIHFSIIETNKLENDTKLMEHVLHIQEKQLLMSKENIDYINVKFHDLKYHLSSLGNKMSDYDREELEKIIIGYNLDVKSGNSALDVILTEKKMVCQRNNIELITIVDGKSIDYMQATEIYTLFGNAIDNSIEAVKKISSKDRHVINVNVKYSLGFSSITIENYYEGNIEIYNDLPKTSKGNNVFHGFGMKSIKMIVEKYNGYMNIDYNDNKFTLSIIMNNK